MTTPLLASLDEAYPSAQIVYATGRWSRAALAGSRYVDRVITLPDTAGPRTWFTLARRLRRANFDLAVIPERSPLAPLAAAAAGIPRRVGYDSAGRGFALTDPVPVTGIRHETERALDLARALGLPAAPPRIHYRPSGAACDAVARLLRDRGVSGDFLIAHPGGGANPGVIMASKRWPPERFAAVAKSLASTYGFHVVIVGGPGDEAVALECAGALGFPATNLAGQLSWSEHAALAALARLYLGNDSGATHLALAAGAPVVAIFGPTDPAMYGPLDPVSEAVWNPDCAAHAERGDLTRARDATRCINSIGVDDVVGAARRVLVRAAAKDVVSPRQ